jgi:hypothetical protein
LTLSEYIGGVFRSLLLALWAVLTFSCENHLLMKDWFGEDTKEEGEGPAALAGERDILVYYFTDPARVGVVISRGTGGAGWA